MVLNRPLAYFSRSGGRLERPVVDADDRLAGADMLIVLDEHLVDMAGDARRQRRDIATDIGVVGRHHEAVGLPPFGAIPTGGSDSEQGCAEQQRLAPLPRRLRRNRTNFHFLTIASHLTPQNEAAMRLVDTVAQRYGQLPGAIDDGHAAALKQLWQLAYPEASTMAYADAFLVIMVAFVIATALVPFLRNVTPKAPPPDAH